MKILCPVDFSENSVNAVEFAGKITEKHQGVLTLMHVYSKEALKKFAKREQKKFNLNADHATLVIYAKNILTDMTMAINNLQPGYHCDSYFIEGEIENKIVELANGQKFDLVVMGTEGVSDVFEKFSGSSTLHIADKLQCPVLCIPDGTVYQDFRKIVYASNYQQEDKEALKRLITLTSPFNPTITVLHVCKKDTLIEEANYRSFIDEIKSYFPNYPLEFIDEQIHENVYLGIHEFMLHKEADLLGLFHHHKNIFQKWFETSTTEEVTYTANYPVIILSKYALK